MNKYVRNIGAIVVVAVVVAGVMFVAQSFRPAQLSLTAYFTDISSMVPGNEVKAAGVNVGSIQTIQLDHGLARVAMTVDRAVLPLHVDARATITDKDLLGEKFIDLERGSPSAPLLLNPPVISADHTSQVVNLQDILNSVDDPTSTALASMVTTLGEGVSGQGGQIAEGIKALRPAIDHADELTRILSEQNKVIEHLTASAQPVASALATNDGKTLDSLVGSTEQTLATTSAKSSALQKTIQQLPGTLVSAQQTLGAVAGVSAETTPVLGSIRPFTDALPRISGELRGFSDAADPALDSLDPVLKRARDMFSEAAPLVSELRRTGSHLRSVSRNGRELNDKAVSAYFGDLMEFLRGWSLSTNQHDSISNYFKGVVPTTPKALGQLLAGPLPGASYAPIPGLPLPKFSAPKPLGPSSDHPAHRGAGPNNATGLTPDQEHSLMDNLLGGN